MDISITEWPILPIGERSPYRRRTYTFHIDQITVLETAIKAAAASGGFDHSLNTNDTANALIRIAQAYLAQR